MEQLKHEIYIIKSVKDISLSQRKEIFLNVKFARKYFKPVRI